MCDTSNASGVRSPQDADDDAIMREGCHAIRPNDCPLHPVARLHDAEDPRPGPCRRAPPPREDDERNEQPQDGGRFRASERDCNHRERTGDERQERSVLSCSEERRDPDVPSTLGPGGTYTNVPCCVQERDVVHVVCWDEGCVRRLLRPLSGDRILRPRCIAGLRQNCTPT